MARALILSLQPPGGGGVQARRYAKLLPHLPAAGWEFHVVGPDPRLDAVSPEPFPDQGRFCHYSRWVSRSQRCAIRKNRRRPGSPLHLWFGLRQLIHRRLERLVRHDPQAHALEGLRATALATAARLPCDVVAGICPDFRVLEVAREVAGKLGKPFIAIYDDPFGHREKGHFHPAHPERQRAVLAAAAGAVFASPLTLERYREQGLLGATPARFLPDCFEPGEAPAAPTAGVSGGPASGETPARPLAPLTLFHPGNLGPWRPIEPLLEAARRWRPEEQGGLQIQLYGYLYTAARAAIRSDPRLRQIVQVHAAVSNERSHQLAEAADGLLVLIGPRHNDNLPSKFFEYLPHATPVLVAGPAGNPLQGIVEDLEKGIYCDIESSAAIFNALVELRRRAGWFRERHWHNLDAIAAYAAPAVAAAWGAAFEGFLATRPAP
ncbi:MAG: glycosyltransferase family 4 protein [Cyanobacteria bacterium K_Offshore_surface_m2_011]|nr:glycosyltransferase family 4 protein [Cyanobacteria bacterium K_Offshore_surface_m2_011]